MRRSRDASHTASTAGADAAGNIYSATFGSVKKISPSGTVTTFPTPTLDTPPGMAFDAAAALHNKHADVRDWVLAFAVEGSCKLNPDEVVPMLRDPDTNVRRTAASYLGSVVHKAAVPGLIELLRDPDQQVRQQATEALTRIRFYHEQEAHWDRVLKGLDASPASAAEKLLVQAKPGANQQQRLLAIQSLGVLGVPEALPFLIDWSQAADADIAAAAKQAITQIHLNPRK